MMARTARDDYIAKSKMKLESFNCTIPMTTMMMARALKGEEAGESRAIDTSLCRAVGVRESVSGQGFGLRSSGQKVKEGRLLNYELFLGVRGLVESSILRRFTTALSVCFRNYLSRSYKLLVDFMK
jgi:hypothetical protein